MRAVRRAGVLAHSVNQPITLFAVAPTEKARKKAQEDNRKARELLEGLGIEVKRVTTALGDPTTQIIKAGANQGIIVVPRRQPLPLLPRCVWLNFLGRY